jgi:hypothetical protein
MSAEDRNPTGQPAFSLMNGTGSGVSAAAVAVFLPAYKLFTALPAGDVNLIRSFAENRFIRCVYSAYEGIFVRHIYGDITIINSNYAFIKQT